MPSQSVTNPKPTLSAEDRTVLKVLQSHRGRDLAVKSAEISALTGFSDRRVRLVIKRLVEDHGQPILSSPVQPSGFYLAQTESEYARAIASLQNRVKSLCSRIDSLVELRAAI